MSVLHVSFCVECQKISLEVKCQNEQLEERYHMACGDVCTIVCRDKVVSVVECTKDLEWNDTIPDERQCPQEQGDILSLHYLI